MLETCVHSEEASLEENENCQRSCRAITAGKVLQFHVADFPVVTDNYYIQQTSVVLSPITVPAPRFANSPKRRGCG